MKTAQLKTTNSKTAKNQSFIVRDWKTGKEVECRSRGAAWWYHILRWDDNNVEIKGKYPLENDITVRIAEKIGISHPGGRENVMTTDFLVTKADGTKHAHSVIASKELTGKKAEELNLEELYWKYRGIAYSTLFTFKINRTLVKNIQLVVKYYDKNKVHDTYGMIKHLIATKQLRIDLTGEVINRTALDRYRILLERGNSDNSLDK